MTAKKAKKAKKPAPRTDLQLRRDMVEASSDKTDKQNRLALRKMVRNYYDIQRLRIQAGGRNLTRAEHAPIQLHEVDLMIIDRRTKQLQEAESAALKDIEWYLKTIPFYVDVLSKYKGVGPTMAAVILGEFDIERQENPSQMWRFAGLAPVPAQRCNLCHQVISDDLVHPKTKRNRNRGLDPDAPIDVDIACELRGQILTTNGYYNSGKYERPVKGKKLPYNAWLRAKMMGVLAPAIIKAVSYHCAKCDVSVLRAKTIPDIETGKQIPVPRDTPIWFHPSTDDCTYTNVQLSTDDITKHESPYRKFYDDYKHRKETAGWGMSPKHRHNAAMRYMVKQMLLDIWTEWRTYLDLPVKVSYHEAKQGGHGYAPPEDIAAVG
jgi:hypothetical protein